MLKGISAVEKLPKKPKRNNNSLDNKTAVSSELEIDRKNALPPGMKEMLQTLLEHLQDNE